MSMLPMFRSPGLLPDFITDSFPSFFVSPSGETVTTAAPDQTVPTENDPGIDKPVIAFRNFINNNKGLLISAGVVFLIWKYRDK